MRRYIILVNDLANLATIKQRIKALGNFFFLDNKTCFLRCNITTSQALYNYITNNDENISVVVVAIGNNAPNDYWGRADRALWDWFRG